MLPLLRACIISVILASSICLAQEPIRFRDIVISDLTGKVMTVEGPVQPQQLGVTVTHEHLFIDLAAPYADPTRWAASRMSFPKTDAERETWRLEFSTELRGALLPNMFGGNRDALILDSVQDAVGELGYFKRAGGGALVDVTTASGRNPAGLRQVSRATGVKVVMGTGFYRTAWHPRDMAARSIDDLVEFMVGEIVHGYENTGIRAGIIGEIGAEDLRFTPTESDEVRVLRAAARASRLTGAAISIHNYIGRPHLWHVALDVLEEEGVDMSRVIVGHITGVDADFVQSLLRRQVQVQFDTLGAPFAILGKPIDNRPNLETILKLVERGYASQLLLSQDVCTKFQLRKHGGFGYDFVLTNFIPYARASGMTERDILQITQRTRALVDVQFTATR